VKLFDQKFNMLCENLDPVEVRTPIKTSKKESNAAIKDFLKYAVKKLGIQKTPVVILNKDKDRVNELRSMAGYMHKENKIWIYTGKRNTADIIRSLAHELVHCKQKESKTNPIDGSTGSEDENEANSVAGVLLRTYGKINPEIYE
jgi:Zn-dependent peptidase ImmA (M78 family)